MRTSVGAHRRGDLVDVDSDTAAGWMSAKLADFAGFTSRHEIIDLAAVEVPPISTDYTKLFQDPDLRIVKADGGAVDLGEKARNIAGADKPRRRKAARDAVSGRVHGRDDAQSAEPVKGDNAG